MNAKPHLLIVDAPGGPHPEIYLPLLPQDINIFFIITSYENNQSQQSRINSISRYTEKYIIADKNKLVDITHHYTKKWRINGILAFSERIIHDIGKVAYEHDLPANSPHTLDALRNKNLQREMLYKAGISIPIRFLIKNISDITLAANYVGFPSVLKPAIGMGSLSVFEVKNIKELESIYETSIVFYKKDARVAGLPLEFLLEQKLVGKADGSDERLADYISVESLVHEEKIFNLAVSDKLSLAYPFRENGHILPSNLPKNICLEAYDLAEQGIKALNINTGAVHTEIKLTKDGPRIIEINGRIGGSVAEQLWHAAQYNVIEDLVNIAFGKKPQCKCVFTKYSAFLTPQPPAHNVKLTKVPTRQQLSSLDGVISAEIIFSEGEEPNWQTGTASNLARIMAVSDQFEKLLALNDELRSDKFFKMEAST